MLPNADVVYFGIRRKDAGLIEIVIVAKCSAYRKFGKQIHGFIRNAVGYTESFNAINVIDQQIGSPPHGKGVPFVGERQRADIVARHLPPGEVCIEVDIGKVIKHVYDAGLTAYIFLNVYFGGLIRGGMSIHRQGE